MSNIQYGLKIVNLQGKHVDEKPDGRIKLRQDCSYTLNLTIETEEELEMKMSINEQAYPSDKRNKAHISRSFMFISLFSVEMDNKGFLLRIHGPNKIIRLNKKNNLFSVTIQCGSKPIQHSDDVLLSLKFDITE